MPFTYVETSASSVTDLQSIGMAEACAMERAHFRHMSADRGEARRAGRRGGHHSGLGRDKAVLVVRACCCIVGNIVSEESPAAQHSFCY